VPYLQVQEEGAESAGELPLAMKPVVVGRRPDCDLVLADPSVSRQHARFYSREGRWWVADLGSAGGTWVNDQRLEGERALAPDDRIVVGRSRLIFSAGETAGLKTVGRVRRRAEPEPPETTLSRERPEPLVVDHQAVEENDLLRTARSIGSLDLKDLAGADEIGPKRASGGDAQLLALVRVSQELHRCADVNQVCQVALQTAMRASGADRGAIAMKEPGESGWRSMAQLVMDKGAALVPGEVKVSRTFVERVLEKREALIAQDVEGDAGLAQAKSVVALRIRSVLCVPLLDSRAGGEGEPAQEEVRGWLYLDRVEGGKPFGGPKVLDLICLIAAQAAAEIGRITEQERRRTVGRFFSSDVVRLIEEAAAKGADLVAARSQVVTILFSDIQGFTALAESLEPEDLKGLLDVYLDRMTEILVDRWGGTLDKYIGDGIMALFGAPYSKGPEVDAKNAVSAALDMQGAMDSLAAGDLRFAQLTMRIGINSGKVVAGMLGSARRREYSVLGDAVNVASRLESTGEAGRIQIGDATRVAVQRWFEVEPAGERKVKNREQPVKCWWVVGPKRA